MRLSLDGGFMPVWEPDGSTLFYAGGEIGDGRMMAVAVTDGATSTWGAPEPLFDFSPYANPDGTRPFDMHPDGQRFLMMKDVADERVVGPHLVFVQGWTEELKRLVPTN